MTQYVLPTTPVSTALTALAGGANSASTPVLNYGFNEADTVVTTNDSFAFPPAVPGNSLWLKNKGASTTKIFGQANPFNGNAVDGIVAHGSNSTTAGGTGVTLASTHCSFFFCCTAGLWNQAADFS
jgi:hypothetical protein